MTNVLGAFLTGLTCLGTECSCNPERSSPLMPVGLLPADLQDAMPRGSVGSLVKVNLRVLYMGVQPNSHSSAPES